MTDIKPENLGFYWSTLFLRAFLKQGLKHVIISPGSRSTPLTMAAAAIPQLEKHIILDERSAAFTALGMGKTTTQPAALICTSGTALANYFPAVIEARKSSVPMLLLTADRPPHLHGTGANQTINQHHIFGEYPVFFRDVGQPRTNETKLREIEDTAAQTYQYSINRKGPVHLNFPFSKPLEPEKLFVQTITKENKQISKESVQDSNQIQDRYFQFDDNLVTKINDAQKPLLIIGQLAPGSDLNHIISLAKYLNTPVLSEQGHIDAAYSIRGFEGFLRDEQNYSQLSPDLIIRFGRQPASKSLLQAIQSWPPHPHIHVADIDEKSNISNTTTDFISWNGYPFELNLLSPKSTQWLERWKQTEQGYFEQTNSLFKKAKTLTDGAVYHHLSANIPDSWQVFISNSFPARDHSMFGQWNAQKLHTNRGASGIDGITSTAMGISIGSEKPAILFTGDLAFLHDTNALLNHDKLKQPLVVIVINNQGGSIFRMLPIVEHQNHFNTYFETPQKCNIKALAQSYGVQAQTIQSMTGLKKIDLKTTAKDAESNVHIIECRTDPDASMQLRQKIWNYIL